MTKSINELQSQTISWLRFPLIMCVIFIHNSQLGDTPYPLVSTENISLALLANYFRIWMSWVLTHISVPCFFVISGFLFFLKTPELTMDVYKTKMKKRFFTLLIPYIIWNIIPLFILIGIKLNKPLLHGWTWNQYANYIIQMFTDHGFLELFWKWNTWGGYYDNWLGFRVLSSGPYNFPLWYLRDLIIISVLTPILYILLKKFGKWLLALLVILYFGNITSPMPGTGTTVLLYFGTGAYLAINRRNIIVEFRKIEKPCYILAIIFMLFATYYNGNLSLIGHYFYCGYILTGVVSAFNLASHLLENNKVKVHTILTSSVFFIYAFHTNWIVSIYDSILNKVLMLVGIDPINMITYITTPFAKAAICIIVCILIDRYFPKIGKLLTGNRS